MTLFQAGLDPILRDSLSIGLWLQLNHEEIIALSLNGDCSHFRDRAPFPDKDSSPSLSHYSTVSPFLLLPTGQFELR